MTQELLEYAIQVALIAHRHQTDKAGLPYILHPLRVMNAVREFGLAAMAVAVLHDVLEDSSTPDALDGLLTTQLPAEVLAAVRLLTRRADVPYEQYLAALKDVALARLVKIADVKDNLGRVDALPPQQAERARAKYTAALRFLVEG
jgi:(p)ppGpp synthase/HD superfamily hydrolase